MIVCVHLGYEAMIMIGLVKTAKGEGAIELREVARPTVRPGHVLIRPEAVGVCSSDLLRYTGKLVVYEPPVILGHEFCGTVVEVGDNVTRSSLGDRVVCETHGTFCGSCYFCMTGQHAFAQLGKVSAMERLRTTFSRDLKSFTSCPHHFPLRSAP